MVLLKETLHFTVDKNRVILSVEHLRENVYARTYGNLGEFSA